MYPLHDDMAIIMIRYGDYDKDLLVLTYFVLQSLL